MFIGDIFDLTQALIGQVDAIYDRAALVALPAQMRLDYAQHITRITGQPPQFLISFDYDQNAMQGPPFAVDRSKIAQLYGSAYALELLESTAVSGGLKGKCPAKEEAWQLKSPR